MTTLSCLMVFLSGASALVFEMIWFRLASLSLGSSVWAASLVLASFMGGLALGNGLLALWGHRFRRPLAVYAAAEVVIAFTGLGLVVLFPHLSGILAPMFTPFLDHPALLNFLRAVTAMCLMILPATAMGATLPLLVRAWYADLPNFGRILGGIYGWNTLGAVAGVMAAEVVLVPFLGLRGSGFAAAAADLSAAFLALWADARMPKAEMAVPPKVQEDGHRKWQAKSWRFLATAFFSGLVLLALEVVWFRFLLLFVHPISWPLAVMLASVLLGIGAGGLAAARWFARDLAAQRYLAPVFFTAGFALVVLYSGFGAVFEWKDALPSRLSVVALCLIFIFPVSACSGVAFTMLGRVLHSQMGSETAASGLLILANTLGAAAGSLMATLLFLPFMGMEKTFFLLALSYGLLALLAHPYLGGGAASHSRTAAFALAWGLALLLFPFGMMDREYFRIPCDPFLAVGEKRVAVSEGVTETVQYLRKEMQGSAASHRLITNSFSMSGTGPFGRRYMKMFVYLSLAMNPGAKKAMIQGFGCGMTAKALTDTAWLSQVDMVDISRNVLEMSRVVFPDPRDNPLHDPRVRIHVEDGRFFLLTTPERYDIITGEPPPPQSAGVANLYSREYFQLVKRALAPGGVFTYWLQSIAMAPDQTRAILQAFLDVFPNGSLWSGSGYEWIMMGSNGTREPPAEEAFSRQWNDPVVGPEMRALGFFRPEQMGTFFLADGKRLADWVGPSPPLLDDRPMILDARGPIRPEYEAVYRDFMFSPGAENNFFRSASVARMWPASLLEKTRPHFAVRNVALSLFVDASFMQGYSLARTITTLDHPLLHDYVSWAFRALDTRPEVLRDLAVNPPETVPWTVWNALAAHAAGEGKYLEAETCLERVAGDLEDWENDMLRVYLLHRGGRPETARRLMDAWARKLGPAETSNLALEMDSFWKLLTSGRDPPIHIEPH